MSTLSLDITPTVSPELQALRDSIELNNRKLEAYLIANTIPVGTIAAFPLGMPAKGWLLLDGSTFSAGTYPDLAAYLGGTTLPDLRGRTLFGRDAGQTEFDTIGEVGGSKSSVGSHGHIQNSHTHAADDSVEGAQTTGSTEPPNHTHVFTTGGEDIGTIYTDSPGTTQTMVNTGGSQRWFNTFNTNGSTKHTHPGQTAGVANSISHGHSVAGHEHDISVDPTTATNQDAGTAAGNLPPYRVVNWAIKT